MYTCIHIQDVCTYVNVFYINVYVYVFVYVFIYVHVYVYAKYMYVNGK